MENKVSEISEMTTDLNSNSETKFDHFTTTTKTTTDQIQKINGNKQLLLNQ